MTTYKTYAVSALATAIAVAGPVRLPAEAAPENLPPTVSVTWPAPEDRFSATVVMKIEVSAADADGSIAEVRFFADTNLIGVVTNAPFNLLWEEWVPCGYDNCPFTLTAVAIDNSGAEAVSAPIKLYQYVGGPPRPVLKIRWPPDGAIFAAPATFAFRAELLAGTSSGQVEFFVGTNSVGLTNGELSATAPPSSITVSNLTAGEYKLAVRYQGDFDSLCTCNWITNTIRVVQLGIQFPILTSDGRLQFEVLTSSPGKQTIIQSSPNLLDWAPVNTNYPSSNIFTFAVASPATNGQRFYRVLVPPE